MASLLEKHKDLLKADALLLCGGPIHQSHRNVVYFSVRGGLSLEMTFYGTNIHLHSGHYGNWGPNPIALLANLISSMRDSDGNILIEGFYDDAQPLTETEKLALKEIPVSWDEELRQELGLAWSEVIIPLLSSGLCFPLSI